jgi:hypothetical protein
MRGSDLLPEHRSLKWSADDGGEIVADDPKEARGSEQGLRMTGSLAVDSDVRCNPVDSIGSSAESRVSHSEPRLLLGFEGTKTARREGISSPFSDARGCTSRRNSGAALEGHCEDIAFSRTGDPALGDFEDAVILKTVGEVDIGLLAVYGPF